MYAYFKNLISSISIKNFRYINNFKKNSELSLNDLIKVTLEKIKHYALIASQDPTVKILKKIFKIKRKESVPAMIEFLMNTISCNNKETSNYCGIN